MRWLLALFRALVRPSGKRCHCGALVDENRRPCTNIAAQCVDRAYVARMCTEVHLGAFGRKLRREDLPNDGPARFV